MSAPHRPVVSHWSGVPRFAKPTGTPGGGDQGADLRRPLGRWRPRRPRCWTGWPGIRRVSPPLALMIRDGRQCPSPTRDDTSRSRPGPCTGQSADLRISTSFCCSQLSSARGPRWCRAVVRGRRRAAGGVRFLFCRPDGQATMSCTPRATAPPLCCGRAGRRQGDGSR